MITTQFAPLPPLPQQAIDEVPARAARRLPAAAERERARAGNGRGARWRAEGGGRLASLLLLGVSPPLLPHGLVRRAGPCGGMWGKAGGKGNGEPAGGGEGWRYLHGGCVCGEAGLCGKRAGS